MRELLPALERRNAFSGATLCALSEPLSPPEGRSPLEGRSPDSRALAVRTNEGLVSPCKRTLQNCPGPSSKKARRSLPCPGPPHRGAPPHHGAPRRRSADRPPGRRGSKGQKPAPNVSDLLQQHRKATVCVC